LGVPDLLALAEPALGGAPALSDRCWAGRSLRGGGGAEGGWPVMRISREREPKGSRRKLPLIAAVAAGGASSWAGWTAPAPARGGLGLTVFGVALAVGTGLLVRSWWRRRPFNLPAPPWRMTSWA